jgi:hypothetical protein
MPPDGNGRPPPSNSSRMPRDGLRRSGRPASPAVWRSQVSRCTRCIRSRRESAPIAHLAPSAQASDEPRQLPPPRPLASPREQSSKPRCTSHAALPRRACKCDRPGGAPLRYRVRLTQMGDGAPVEPVPRWIHQRRLGMSRAQHAAGGHEVTSTKLMAETRRSLPCCRNSPRNL